MKYLMIAALFAGCIFSSVMFSKSLKKEVAKMNTYRGNDTVIVYYKH